MARKKSTKLVTELNKRQIEMTEFTLERIELKLLRPENEAEWLNEDTVETIIDRMLGYNIAFEDVLHLSNCYNGYSYPYHYEGYPEWLKPYLKNGFAEFYRNYNCY